MTHAPRYALRMSREGASKKNEKAAGDHASRGRAASDHVAGDHASNDHAASKVAASRIGLCANCRFMRKIESDRGSIFYLCQLSATDASFAKYPRLPVLQCPGYEALNAGSAQTHE
jgi:hypothetical protein